MDRLKQLLCCALLLLPLDISADTEIYSGNSSKAIIDNISDHFSSINCGCMIAIGPTGLKEALAKKSNAPIFTVGISAASYIDIRAQYPEHQITAIYKEPNPKALVSLGSIIFGNHSLAMFYSDRTTYIKDHVDESILIKTDKSQIRKELSRLSHIDVIIAIPDSNIWNKQSFRMAVNSLYRQGKALIGFNQSLAKAGAIAALYTDDKSIVIQLNKMIDVYMKTGVIIKPSYPEHYQVEVNQQIARTLNIPLPSTVTLMETLEKELRHE